MPWISMTASRKEMIWRFLSWTTLLAWIDHVGCGFLAQTGQGVKIAWLSSWMSADLRETLVAAIEMLSFSRLEKAMATPTESWRSSMADWENWVVPSVLTIATLPLAVTMPVLVS